MPAGPDRPNAGGRGARALSSDTASTAARHTPRAVNAPEVRAFDADDGRAETRSFRARSSVLFSRRRSDDRARRGRRGAGATLDHDEHVYRLGSLHPVVHGSTSAFVPHPYWRATWRDTRETDEAVSRINFRESHHRCVWRGRERVRAETRVAHQRLTFRLQSGLNGAPQARVEAGVQREARCSGPRPTRSRSLGSPLPTRYIPRRFTSS